MISLGKRFLYVHIPKTAGNAVQTVLRAHSEDSLVAIHPHHDGVERFEVRNPAFALEKHSTLRDYRRELGAELFAQLFKMTCVRNPWDRAISYYFSPSRGESISWDREAFVQRLGAMAPVVHFLALDDDNGHRSPFDNVDYVMRFERLQEGFDAVCDVLGLRREMIPVRNRSAHAHYSTYYDSELVELVGRNHADEIARFGYVFESRDG